MTVAVTDGARSPALASTKRCFGATPTIRGTAGSDRIEGTDGPDVIVSGGGNDIVSGGGGNDLICGGRGSDSISGGGGDDRLGTGRGRLKDSGRNIGIGGPGDDKLVGGPANDQFSGDAGDDVMRGRGGPDLFYGGEGGVNRIFGAKDEGPLGDLIEYSGTRGRVRVDLRRGVGRGRRGRDLLQGVEDIAASASAKLVGNRKANLLHGSNYDDTLVGRGGNDCIYPTGGDNDVRGGSGFDYYTANVAHACGFDDYEGGVNPGVGTGVTVDLEQGEAQYGGTTELRGIEGVYGSHQEDAIYGDEGPNVLYGAGAADDIRGRGGDDHLFGGGQTDALDGGEGTDECTDGEVVVSCE